MSPAGPTSPAYFLYHFFWCALDWIFVPTCGGCGLLNMRWCETCQNHLSRLTGSLCPQCGEPQPEAELCASCIAHPPAYQSLRSYAWFEGPIRDALHNLKYKQDIGLGEALSKHLIELYNQLNWEIDIVAPVPIGAQRIKERGYNQAGMLGRPLAYAIQKPYQAVLRKKRETRSQVGLTAHERQENVEGAFEVIPNQVKGRTILIIDDITTTGSTINACARSLHQAGASAVYGLTLARAILPADTNNQPIHIS